MNAPVIILIRPQLGENIGAVARAMSNFGLSSLRIVAPRDGWPNEAAEAMAAHAAPIIHAARIFETLPEALADIQVAYATTARPREVEKPVLAPSEAVAEMGNAKSALLFGPERTGLTNEDLGWCHSIITIPTAENASLNIAQSAVVVLYEWWKLSSRAQSRDLKDPSSTAQDNGATMQDYAHFFDQLEAKLDAGHFFKVPEKKPGMWLNVKNMFLRARHTDQELRTLHGIVRALSEK